MIEKLREFLYEAKKILRTEYSFERPERVYLEALALIRGAPDMQEDFCSLITRMYADREVDDESIAYLMYVLRWQQIFTWAKNEIKALDFPMSDARPYQNILDAYDDNWENIDFYPHILEERQRQVELGNN